MSYLYNAYEGSLTDLEQRLQNYDENEHPELDDEDDGYVDPQLRPLDHVIRTTWKPVGQDLLSEIDWHELEDLVALAERRIPGHANLLHGLFVDPPLGIQPADFGWTGSLGRDDRRALVAALAGVLDPGEVELVALRHHRDPRPIAEQEPADLSLIYVFITLRDVAEENDVVVAL